MRGWKALVFLAGWSACYSTPTGDEPCTITCVDDCPGDLTCQNGFCVGDGEECAPGFTSISMGGGFSCALDTLSDLWCWGTNDHHQIDPGTEPLFTIARRVATDRKYQQVSTGRAHVCAISDGALFCWGANDRGQISASVRGDVTEPTRIATTGGPEKWRSVTAGFQSTCAIADDGRLFCWGRNDSGQLGIGTITDAGSPVPVASELADWTLVALGGGQSFGQHACAVSASAGLMCWGSNTFLQLADAVAPSSDVPLPVALPDVTALALAAYSTCAISSGDVYCWGYDSAGSLGDPAVVPAGNPIATPTLATALRGGWTELGAGEIGVCGLHGDQVFCWGISRNGNGAAGGAWLPGQAGFTQTVAEGAEHVAVGFNESIDLAGGTIFDLENGCYLGGGAIRCWGDNRFGQLAQGATAETPTPLEIVGGRTWTQLATGVRHTCGIDGDGKAACWGSTLGAAVDGTLAGTVELPCDQFACDPSTPQTIGDADAIAIGTDHTCALAGATISCWGDNSFDQHGVMGTTTTPSTVPGTFTGLFDAHGNATCGSTATDVTCWGNGSDPVPVVEAAGMTSVTTSGIVGPGFFGFGCFLDTDHTLSCAGDNSLGQYGNGECPLGGCLTCGDLVCNGGETTATCPGDCGTGAFSKLRSYIAFSLGWDIDDAGAPACGVIAGGSVECWGRNAGGMISQEIDGTTGQPFAYLSQPVPIKGLETCSAVSVGRRHACALCNDDIVCWGDHRHGAVGSGTQTFIPVVLPRPIDITLDPGDRWVSVTSGVGFSCGLTEAGRGYCWGGNQHGALGLGAAASTVPILVRAQ